MKVKVKNLQNNVKYMQDDTDNHCLKACLPHTSWGKGARGRECTDFASACGFAFLFFYGKNAKYNKTTPLVCTKI